MSDQEATTTLIVRAQDLASGAIDTLGSKLTGVGDTAKATAGRITSAFAGMGNQLAIGIGMVTETLASGGGLGPAMAQLGVFMAGQLAETFGGQIIEKIAGSSFIAVITAPITAAGTAIGGFLAAAIPIGMAALPFILIGALIAAIGVLIVNEDIRNKVFAFAGQLVGNLVDALGKGLGVLGDLVGKAFAAVWQLVLDAVGWYIDNVVRFWLELPGRLLGLGASLVETIVGGLSSLPGRIADIVRSAFAGLRIDVGPFHITGQGITVDFPDIKVPGLATGGRVIAGGAAIVGERGPELVNLPSGSRVVPNHALAATAPAVAGVFLEGVTERDIMALVDRGMYVRLRRAGTVR